MSKCECCKEENSDLITYKGYKMCPTCYMGYVRKVKVCENNAKYETEIDQLKQQLAEKDKEIAHLKEKDNYHLRYELAGADETITNLKQQLEEKDKEIAHLKDFIGCKGCLDVIKKSNDNQTQLAIQELEKVKTLIQNAINFEKPNFVEVYDAINKQINDLKGEKDVED